MPKRILEDMVRVRQVKQPPKKEPAREVVKPAPDKIQQIHKIHKTPAARFEAPNPEKKKKSGYMLWVVALVSVSFCFFAVSFLFSKAEVSIDPKTEDVTLNEGFSAVKNSSGSGLSFDLVILDGSENATVPTSGEKDVADKAAGTVVLYNNFGASPQTLDIDTRLEGSNGKLYKTKTKTVVPGKEKDGTPGSVEVGIYAAEAGAEYNSGPLDFQILGFKGTPKYSKFYGRSTGEITGGFKGKTPAITDLDRANAISGLKAALQEKLLLRATRQTPDGLILFKDAVFLTADDANISTVYNSDNTATLTLKGSLSGILFNENALGKKIAKAKIEKYDGSDVYIPDIKNLAFALVDKDSGSFAEVKNINFNLSGPAKIVSKIDADKLAANLLGKPKKDFTQIVSQYPNIESSTLALRPFWRRTLPEESKNIKITINYPK